MNDVWEKQKNARSDERSAAQIVAYSSPRCSNRNVTFEDEGPVHRSGSRIPILPRHGHRAHHRRLRRSRNLRHVLMTRSQELLERKIKNAPEGQGAVRMLTREEWVKCREIRPRTPYESKFLRPDARIRSGEPLRMVFVMHGGDWIVWKDMIEVGKVLVSQFDLRDQLYTWICLAEVEGQVDRV
ncbi:hypothetical protein Fmac_005955 [Flemingia macrophylla]|uniref:Uncharacterized protein n=1 Tax=Flemingia macrophylla TaxID=520843 RepID=A0ABD1N993_9FABA